MFVPKTSTRKVRMTYGFGFAEQMRDADWGRFPTWYRARCLLRSVPQGAATGNRGAFRPAA